MDFLKFRAWIVEERRIRDRIVEEGKMVKVTSLVPGGPITYPYLSDVHGSQKQGYPTALMMFTGLLDKTGREIYEGDIVTFPWLDEEVIGVVRFGEFNIEGGANTYPRICGFFVEYILVKDDLEEDCVSMVDSLYDLDEILVLGNVLEDIDRYAEEF